MSDETLDLLRRIAKDVADIKAAMAAGVGASAAALGIATSTGGGAGGGVASERELDSEHGDPIIRKDPPRWSGESFVGCHYSQTTPEYLDEVAGFKDWQASKNDGVEAKKKYAAYDRKDAARARGWAARMRAGWKPPRANGAAGNGQAANDEDYDDGGYGDEVPF